MGGQRGKGAPTDLPKGAGSDNDEMGGGGAVVEATSEGSGAQTDLPKGDEWDADETGGGGAADDAKDDGDEAKAEPEDDGAAGATGEAMKKKRGWKRKPSKNKKQRSQRDRVRRSKHNAYQADATNPR